MYLDECRLPDPGSSLPQYPPTWSPSSQVAMRAFLRLQRQWRRLAALQSHPLRFLTAPLPPSAPPLPVVSGIRPLRAAILAAVAAGTTAAATFSSCEAAKSPATAEDALYPAIEPFHSGTLKVSDVHTLYYEECGNPQGKVDLSWHCTLRFFWLTNQPLKLQPVIIVHGGPGSGCSAGMRRYHDPKFYRIVLLDQRGAGKSSPHASLHENTCVPAAKLHEHSELFADHCNGWQYVAFD